MKLKLTTRIVGCLIAVVTWPGLAFAGDAATVIFKSGQVVRIDDGYQTLVEAMDGLNGKDVKHQILKMKIGGSSFLMNIAEVVIVCRDNCSNITILHQLDPKRAGGNSNVSVDNSRLIVK